MKNFLEFQRTKVKMTKAMANKLYDYEAASEECFSVYCYADGYIIEEYIDGTYQVIYGNTAFANGDLEQVEEVLWDDFVKHELPISQFDLEVDIQARMKSFLYEHEIKLSLDEAIHNNEGGFTDEGMAYAKRLFKAWEYIFKEKENKLSSICIMDNSTCTVHMYHNVPGTDNEEIEHWIQESSDHKLSESTWMAVENSYVEEVTL